MIEIILASLIKNGAAANAGVAPTIFSFSPAFFQNAGAFQSVAANLFPMLILILVVFLSVILPLLFIIPMIADWRKNKYLLQNGERARARILEIRDTGVSLNDNPQVRVLLEVYAVDRPVFRAETKSIVPRLQIPMVQVGSSVEVTFDPQDPSRIALVI